MKQVRNIVYLYSEVMPYAIAVMRALVTEFGVEVDCVHWDDKRKKTPFAPASEQGIAFHGRSGFNKATLVQLIENKQPTILYISGRMDPLYMEVALYFKNKLKIVSGCDGQWYGSLKNKLSVVMSHTIYRKYFEYMWVSSQRSYEYMRRMGYANNRIINNLYTGDDAVFPAAYLAGRNEKARKYPHQMVFVGRFAPEKGLDLLVEAFAQAKKATNNDWTLTLVGSGTTPVVNEPFIQIRDFMPSTALASESRNWGVFCLPSLKEPWGVVVHEFTMAGLPVICSDNVGAGDSLVINNYNGYVFQSGSVAGLKRAMMHMMEKTDAELQTMSQRSHELSQRISPLISAYSLMSVVE